MKIIPVVIWVLVFIVLGGLLYWVTTTYSNDTLSIGDWISVFGSYASIYSLFVILIQFQSVKETTAKTQEEISKITSITEWSRYAEMASNLKNDIRHDYYELTGYKLHHLKQALLSIPSSMLENDSDLRKSQQEYIKAINGHISSLDSYVLNNQNELSREKMMMDMEQVSDLFRKMVNIKIR